jgi:hypothetical protein
MGDIYWEMRDVAVYMLSRMIISFVEYMIVFQ